MTVTLGELAVRFGCELRGDPAATVDSVAALSQAGPAVDHLSRQSQVRRAARGHARGRRHPRREVGRQTRRCRSLVAANPHATYARVATLLHPDPPLESRRASGGDRRGGAPASIPSAEIAAQAYVGEGVRIGARCYIGPGVGHRTRMP